MHWKAKAVNKKTKENITLYLEAKNYTVESLRENLEEVYPGLEILNIMEIEDPRIKADEKDT